MFISTNVLRIFVSGLLVIGYLGLFGFKSFNRFLEEGVTITKYEFIPEKVVSPGKVITRSYILSLITIDLVKRKNSCHSDLWVDIY